MVRHELKCKYCDSKITGGTTCGECNKKLILVRQLLGMVKDAKTKVERDQRIKEDLEKVRKDDR